jgi:DNA-binding CsgD family transcriptional regulator
LPPTAGRTSCSASPANSSRRSPGSTAPQLSDPQNQAGFCTNVAGNRTQARTHLRAACETFEGLGATPWAERARVELQATGETARKRDPSTISQLTPQELQIARLVGAGGTNREIAAELFLSPRTIDYHLHKIFTKLGMSSRSELVRLDAADDAAL